MTSSEAVERALRKIKPDATREEMTSLRTALNVSITRALRMVAEIMAMRPAEDVERQLLETTNTIAITSGVANLATYAASNTSHLTNTIRLITHPDSTYPLQQLTDEQQLQFPWPKHFIYFCISGDKIKTRNTDGDLTTLTGDLTITLLAVPTVANIHKQLEPYLIDAMVAEINAQPQASQTRKAKRPAA